MAATSRSRALSLSRGRRPEREAQSARGRERGREREEEEEGVSVEAYSALELRQALVRREDYVEAAAELAALLLSAYGGCRKMTQVALFADVMHGLQQVSVMEGSRQLAAAQRLLRAAEAVLPMQRRAAASSVYKRAALALHRRKKRSGNGGGASLASDTVDDDAIEAAQLPEDVVSLAFEFLDPSSLACAAAVCHAWRHVAAREALWERHFRSHFADMAPPDWALGPEKGEGEKPYGWQKAFSLAQENHPSRVKRTRRAFCRGCGRFLWLPAGSPTEEHVANLPSRRPHKHTWQHVSASQVAQILLGNLECINSESEDSEEELPGRQRLWAFRR